jgi:hypothetical protein
MYYTERFLSRWRKAFGVECRLIVGRRKMLAENVGRTRLCLGCEAINKKSMVTRRIALQFTLPPHNDGAGRRVAARIESRFQTQSKLRLADLLACPSRDLGAFDPRGSSARILP